MKALIIEDNFDFIEEIRRLIDTDMTPIDEADAQNRFTCYSAGNLTDARKIYIESEYEIDVGIFDLALNSSDHNGIDIARELLKLNPFPIIFVSQHANWDLYKNQVRELGIPDNYDLFLPKFRENTFSKHLNNLQTAFAQIHPAH